MKKYLFTLVAVAAFFSSFAQQPKIQKSVPFDEPDYGWSKIMQLKNGNTFFFHGVRKEGITVKVYDKNRKQASVRLLKGKLWDEDKLKRTKTLGLYEINGEPVLFICQADDNNVPRIFRIRLNASNGSVVKEDMLGSLPKVTMGQGYAAAFGHVDPSDIIVEKDPASDCYAVIIFNGFAHDRNERIKVMHFDGTHNKLSEAFYESPNGAYKYLRFLGTAVDGSKQVFVTTYAYNGKKGGPANPQVIVSRMKAGDTAFKHNLLTFSEDFDDTKSLMLFNHGANKLELLLITLIDQKHNGFTGKTTRSYATLLAFIDGETLSLVDKKTLTGQKINEYAQKHIDKDYEFTGVPQHMVINKDNTTTVLMEEIEVQRTSSGRVNSVKTLLGVVGVAQVSETGEEISGYAVNKRQLAEDALSMLYLNERSKGRFMPTTSMNFMKGKGNVNQFLSFDYINAPASNYIIFNDIMANYEKDEDETKRKTMQSVSGSNTICFKLSNGSIEKSFLFGTPEDKSSTFSYIEVSDYNKENNTYATMIVEREGRDKQARIAWVTFE